MQCYSVGLYALYYTLLTYAMCICGLKTMWVLLLIMYALWALFYGCLGLTKVMHLQIDLQALFYMDLWVLDCTLLAYKYVGLTLIYMDVLWAMNDGSAGLVL